MVFDQYKGQSMLNLYDSIACLSENLHDKIQDPKIQEILVGLLLKKWASTSPDDVSFTSLLGLFSIYKYLFLY